MIFHWGGLRMIMIMIMQSNPVYSLLQFIYNGEVFERILVI